MGRRRYISTDHFHAPFQSLPFQGLGSTRSYYETAWFRAPYQNGYFQDNTLQGLGQDAGLEQLTALQQALSISASGQWDAATQAAVSAAQQRFGLPVTGYPDAALLAALGMLSLPIPPSRTWQRDLGTPFNQIPQLGYAALAVLFFGLSYVGYKRWKKTRGKSESSSAG